MNERNWADDEAEKMIDLILSAHRDDAVAVLATTLLVVRAQGAREGITQGFAAAERVLDKAFASSLAKATGQSEPQ